jgi:predicted lipase
VYEGNPPGSGTFGVAFKNFVEQLSSTNKFGVTYYQWNIAAIGTDTEVVILDNSQMILVVFRGTEGVTAFRDWLTNMQHEYIASPVSWGGKVLMHTGFYGALSAQYNNIKATVKARRNNSQKIFLAGHSLGGALATLCAYRLHKVDKLPIAGVYTFGSPRVGDTNFSADYTGLLGSKTFRWVKYQDFAANLPVMGLYMSSPSKSDIRPYKHVGKLNYIKANGDIQMDRADFNYGLGPSSINDHSMYNYCVTLYGRLSKDHRSSASNPAYLVKDDVPAGGMFG